MKFMVIVKATKESEAGEMPTEQELAEMMRFNEELVKAGVMLDGAGLQPSKAGARIQFDGASRTVLDGPFSETKELIAGYWVLQCKSLAECVEWIKRAPCPSRGKGEIEIRPYFELTDFTAASEETIALANRLQQQTQQHRS